MTFGQRLGEQRSKAHVKRAVKMSKSVFSPKWYGVLSSLSPVSTNHNFDFLSARNADDMPRSLREIVDRSSRDKQVALFVLGYLDYWWL